MGAELIVTAVIWMQSFRSDEWVPEFTLDHQMAVKSLEACERTREQMEEEIGELLTEAVGQLLVAEYSAKPDEFRVTTTAACQRSRS